MTTFVVGIVVGFVIGFIIGWGTDTFVDDLKRFISDIF